MKKTNRQIHPYANMAWSILSAIPKVRFLWPAIIFDLRCPQTILAQVDRDSCIIRLVGVINDVYSFVEEAEPMKKIESHRRIISLMAQQTTECAYFIRDYASNKSFCAFFSTLRAHKSHCQSHHQGNEPLRIVSCRTLIAK